MSKQSRPWSPRERKRRKVMLRTRRHLDILRVMDVIRSRVQLHETRAFERFYSPISTAVITGIDLAVPGSEQTAFMAFMVSRPGGDMDVVFDAYLPVRDNEGRRVCYSVGPGRVRMHPENRDHLDDVFVKPGPDLREPPAWLTPIKIDEMKADLASAFHIPARFLFGDGKPSSAVAMREYYNHVYGDVEILAVDEMADVDSDKLPPPDPRAAFWTPDED